jgi:U3 small nucleolar RNA-associated protein 16
VLQKQAKERKQEKAAAPATTANGTETEVREGDQAQEEAQESTFSRKRKLEVPDLLPPEFLESDDEEDLAPTPKSAQAVRPKKIKFADLEKQLAREARPPRDERVGSTVYRVVAAQEDKRMAPKMDKSTRNLKESMLARKRIPQKKGGFLVKSR